MTLSLHTLKPKSGSRTVKKRIGRGLGSTGSYSGRGVKGQRARSGGRSGLKLKGLRGLMLATPKKRGFTTDKIRPKVVNLSDLSKLFSNNAKITPKILYKKGLINDFSFPVKILGDGTIAISLTIEGCFVSHAAKQKIEQAGGTVIAV